jgi:hypothetical protein
VSERHQRSPRTFLAEGYSPALTERGRAERLARLRGAAVAIARTGRPVALLASVDVPLDETCLLLFRAESRGDVEAILEQAGISCDRIVQAWVEAMASTHPGAV